MRNGPDPTLIVERYVRRLPDTPHAANPPAPQDFKPTISRLPETLRDFRETPAWVLLAEPGAGKTTAFEQEADQSGGKYLRIAEFIELDEEADWRDKVLFLDGLDEVRAGSGDSTLLKIRNKLNKLGKPPFRIACRAADWYGETDRKNVYPDGELTVLLLEPLSEDSILDLLRENHEIAEPAAFVQEAKNRRIDGLLNNPQMLELLAKAVQGEQWPATRQKTYELACTKMADENNPFYQVKQLSTPVSVESRLQAAGQLCAVLLLANQSGVAPLPVDASAGFPDLRDFSPPDQPAALQALGSTLFRPRNAQHLAPAHRTIAEFLAARWLSQQIENKSLPVRRVLNLLLGTDGKTVADLRGLYAWLATLSLTVRARLIQADPFTVLVYGDAAPFSTGEKRQLLQGLQRNAAQFPDFFWQTNNTYAFSALADKGLLPDFRQVLTDRHQETQDVILCVLKTLAESRAFPEFAELAEPVFCLVVAPTFSWRVVALQAWLNLGGSNQQAQKLLDDIVAGELSDSGNGLQNFLLEKLYPSYISPEALLNYLSPMPQNNWIFDFVWSRFSPPRDHLPILLDQLALRKTTSSHPSPSKQVISNLLLQAIEQHGDSISNDRLFQWLGVGLGENGLSFLGSDAKQYIQNWLEQRPNRYKALLAVCYQKYEDSTEAGICLYGYKSHLYQAKVPDDLGGWHLEQVAQTRNEALINEHLLGAIDSLRQNREKGLSQQSLEDWGKQHPAYQNLLYSLQEGMAQWQLDIQQEQEQQYQALKQERAEQRRINSQTLNAEIADIRSGRLDDRLHELANQMGYIPAIGLTSTERFERSYENGAEILAAAETGFRACVRREDLPDVAEIIVLSTQQREHLVSRPCLIGMDLLWQDGESVVAGLPDGVLRKMLAFRLADGTGENPNWFTYLAVHRPELMAEVLVPYAKAMLSAGRIVYGLHPLAHDTRYQAVAKLAAPDLLRAFPLQAKSGQQEYLSVLLLAAYAIPEFRAIVVDKVACPEMDELQKVHWLAVSVLLNPSDNQAACWEYVEDSPERIASLSAFFSYERFRERFFELPPDFLAKFIEIKLPKTKPEPSNTPSGVRLGIQNGLDLRMIVARLGAQATPEAGQEIERLLGLSNLPSQLRGHLEAAQSAWQNAYREREFHFATCQKIAQILTNQAPTSSGDLKALALDYLDDIAEKIRFSKPNHYRQFWSLDRTVKKSEQCKQADKRNSQSEDDCRDVFLGLLEDKFSRLGIGCDKERYYVQDKRADICLTYQNRFEVPVEIKGEWHDQVWTAAEGQLVKQYTIDPNADGFGIYLVFWFGGRWLEKSPEGEKPTNPQELQERLEAQLSTELRKKISVFVLDVTPPHGPQKDAPKASNCKETPCVSS